ncbi:MAG TPA: antitoxin Xre-like helix-turn-helix domain-containing protein [Acetobacteraceae bacterium]|nr:antitoxin Xre-like helix-turn-helix domain-containing protein [Acetobacteraceae bacterium]
MSNTMPPTRNNAGQRAAMNGTPGPAPHTLRPLRATSPATSVQTFFHIARLWKLTVAEQMILLGLAARSTYFQWKRCGKAILPRDTSERIFYLVGIHQALLDLVPDGASLPDWLRQPSDTDISSGKSLLRRLLLGRVADLYLVHLHLVDAAKKTARGRPCA